MALLGSKLRITSHFHNHKCAEWISMLGSNDSFRESKSNDSFRESKIPEKCTKSTYGN